ncbi:MAG TPA: tRNA pseudouridine(55) synthase TruB [Steroidobacteraceae bacterium]
MVPGAAILLLDKPVGLSSNAALQRTRRLFGGVKAGHVGSLDPLASGMLPICLGEATKLAGDILAGRKFYHFALRLGARTSTGDREGAIVETRPVPHLTGEQLGAVLQQFQGQQMQLPPMFSAIKQGGQPLYRLARAGLEVERSPRSIHIAALHLGEWEATLLQLEVLCSKGTYVRTLAEDFARALGTCGHVEQLRRIYVEPFVDCEMETLESIERAQQQGRCPLLLDPDRAVQHLPAVQLSHEAAERILHGQAIGAACASAGRLRLYDASARFLGIGESDGAGSVRPRRLFVRGEVPLSDGA